MILEINNLNKSFSTNHGPIEILKGLELSVSPGDTVAILGKSGSGKSTLLSLLSGLDHPDSGSIKFDGIDISGLSEDDLTTMRAQKLSIIFQQFHLLPHLTALENVMLPLDIKNNPDSRSLALEALAEVDLSERASHFPGTLSGGEKQRVAFARAMASSPKLLLADEPTGSLDSETGEKVIQMLFDLVEKKGSTLLLVTHSKEWAKRCKSVLVLQEGRLTKTEL